MLDLGLVFHIGVLMFGCIFPYLENMILIIKKNSWSTFNSIAMWEILLYK